MNINSAIESLKKGNVLILPTDTLYGLGAIAYKYEAVKKVFDLKKRDYSKALPVHYGSIELIKEDCIINDKCIEIASNFWPGGLTIVLKKKEFSKLVFAKDTVAVRIPNNKILLEILKTLNKPIVMPSANISDCDNIFIFNKIKNIFKINGIEDDSNLSKNPSTIIECIGEDIKILRKGVVKF